MVHSRLDLGSFHVLISDGRVIISVSAPHCLRDRLNSSQSTLYAIYVSVHTYIKCRAYNAGVSLTHPPCRVGELVALIGQFLRCRGIHHMQARIHHTGNITGLVIILLISYLSNGEGPLLPPRGGSPAEFSRKRWTPD